jgi:hypothetical protein
MKSLSATKEHSTTSKPCEALMYRIDGLSGSVITITARQDFVLQAKTVDTKTRTIMADAPVKVVAGTVLHFAESSLPGWYYVGRVEHGKAACSCPARKPCKHMPLIMAAYEALMTRKCPPVPHMPPELPDNDAEVSAECPVDVLLLPAQCPQDEEFSEGVADRWTQEALSREAYVALFGIYDLSY